MDHDQKELNLKSKETQTKFENKQEKKINKETQ